MGRKKQESTGRPTDAEFTILRAIWELGPSTVRQVSNHLNESQEIGYTTVLKMMQVMSEKGLLERDTSQRPQIYRPASAKEETQKTVLRDLAQKAFGGSAGSLVLQALNLESTSPQELREIRDLIKSLEEKA